MKTQPILRYLRAMLMVCIAAMTTMAHAAPLTIPGANGSDGALNITVSTNIDLGLASTGPWDTNNTANAGNGVYDADKWAVVFKYTSVNIANGATVTFKNHPSRAPVVWLVNGNVMIDGVVDLNGANGDQSVAKLLEGGPGGFRAGAREQTGLGVSGGFGPGGGFDQHGQYGTGQPNTYGNAQIIPLIGGSGGSAGVYSGNSGNYRVWNGGGGGGAILIAASESTTISGTGRISVNGGSPLGNGAWGSGGAVRLISDQILGSGRLQALGAYPGRVRLEGNVVSQTLSVAPVVQSVVPNPVVLWPAPEAPSVRVVSVSGQAAPADPRARMENNPADVTLASGSAVTVVLETANFPTNGTVNVFVKPRNASQSTYQATWISGDTNAATWRAQHVFLPGYAVIQARAVAP